MQRAGGIPDVSSMEAAELAAQTDRQRTAFALLDDSIVTRILEQLAPAKTVRKRYAPKNESDA